jgi:hypothetical protein
MTLTEMLDLKNKLTAVAQRKFHSFFRHPDLIRIGVDIRIAELARDLRDFYFQQYNHDGLPTIELGDAIHLASAIHFKADRFMTFDERDQKKSRKARRGLVNLSGNVAGHPLRIEKPLLKNPQMPLGLPAPPGVVSPAAALPSPEQVPDEQAQPED